MNSREGLFSFSRYIIIVLLGLFNLFVFYFIFTPLTIYPVYWILNVFFNASIIPSSKTIILDGVSIYLIGACIAGAAYYLLTILNLSTPMPIKKRMQSIIFLFITFLILNILRIVVFSVLYLSGYSSFNLAHEITWYFGSTILLVIVWFLSIYIFKIKAIPIYTDVKNIIKDFYYSKKSKRKL